MIILGVAIAIVLVVVAFLVIGNKGTKLTVDNYTDYLNISATILPTEHKETKKHYWLGAYGSSGYKLVETRFNTGYVGRLTPEVVAPNYNFNNVKVTIHFTGKVLTMLENSDPDNPITAWHNIDFVETFELSVGGTVKGDKYGNGSFVALPQNMLILSDLNAYWYDYRYNIKEIKWEIVEISGTVSPA